MLSPHQQACEEAIDLLTRPKPQFHIQSVADLNQLTQLWEIDKAAYADCSLSLERFREWWERYEFGSKLLLDGDRILASIGIYPLSEEQALAFADGRIPERDLVPVSLAECERQPQKYWYASGIVVVEELRGWGSPLKTLLQLGLSYWRDSGHIAYPMSLVAIAEYDIGARLLGYLGFSKVCSGSSLPDGCDLYQVSFDSEQQFKKTLRLRGL